MKKRTKFAIFSAAMLVAYLPIQAVCTWHGTPLPDSMTVAWYSGWIFELGYLFGIEIKKKDETEEASSQKRGMKKRTKFAIFSAAMLVAYLPIQAVCTWHGTPLPDSMTAAWYGGWIFELGYLFGIEIKKNEQEVIE